MNNLTEIFTFHLIILTALSKCPVFANTMISYWKMVTFASNWPFWKQQRCSERPVINLGVVKSRMPVASQKLCLHTSPSSAVLSGNDLEHQSVKGAVLLHTQMWFKRHANKYTWTELKQLGSSQQGPLMTSELEGPQLIKESLLRLKAYTKTTVKLKLLNLQCWWHKLGSTN